MWNNGSCGGNWCWIIILLLLFCGCGNNNGGSNMCCNYDTRSNCACDNNCGCC